VVDIWNDREGLVTASGTGVARMRRLVSSSDLSLSVSVSDSESLVLVSNSSISGAGRPNRNRRFVLLHWR